jgi:hypothetical protein
LTPALAGWLKRNFYFSMALLIAAIVAYGFGRTLDAKLIHPASPRPLILYVHAIVFTLWVAIFVAQTALVRQRLVRWHMRLGILGLAVGTVLPFLGAATGIVMANFNMRAGQQSAPAFLIFPIAYMLAFGVLFGFAAAARRKHPEFHRRLMFVATCTLTVAAFARFPNVPLGMWDVCVDLLIFMGIARDWIVNRELHVAYRYALPAVVALQIVINVTFLTGAGWWLQVAHFLLQA